MAVDVKNLFMFIEHYFYKVLSSFVNITKCWDETQHVGKFYACELIEQ